MLELRKITKQFGAFTALDGVDFRAGGGEIVGLLGENGAGKSTLLGLVSGNLLPTSGEMLWHDKPLHLRSPREATALGIGIVHQHFQLVPSFTVAENLALAAPHAHFVFSPKQWHEKIREWAKQLDWTVDPARRVEELGVGERQRVEIIKALFAHGDESTQSRNAAQLLLLDEPTANLTPDEVDDLFAVLQRLKSQGCGLVFVSHKLNEVLELCDRVAVLRRGQLVGERIAAQTDAQELAELMVGRALDERTSTTPQTPVSNDACLQIKSLSAGMLCDFSLQVRRGEIVGLAGVDGNGQAELVEVLSGLRATENGTIDAQRIAVIPPDRRHAGLIISLTLAENLALHPALRAECKRRLSFNWKMARTRTQELMRQYDVRAPQTGESTPASQLSGGNQQKLIIARALSFPHDVVIAADPTRGLDFAATQFVRNQLRQAAAQGSGVLLISTDLDEVLELSHRVGVLYAGRLLPGPELLPRGVDRREVGKLMGGFQHEPTAPALMEQAGE
jgi:simple sugar transport system ATP-binding protein